MNTTKTTSRLTKLAAIRDNSYPMGQPAPCHFNCPCGTQLPAFEGDVRCSTCGTEYTSTGWVK